MREVPDGSQHTCITSPPYYGLRSYLPEGHPDKAHEIGTERTPEEYADKIVAVGREVWRCLREDATWWLNLGDTYAAAGRGERRQVSSSSALSRDTVNAQNAARACDSVSPKNLLLIPYRVALALQADGWIVRSIIPWYKPNAMPGSQKDRPTVAHEALLLLAKSPRYFFDIDAERVQGSESTNRTIRTSDFFRTGLLWNGDDLGAFWVPTTPYTGGHYAVFPPGLIAPMVRLSTSEAGCCPSCGAPWRRVRTVAGLSTQDAPQDFGDSDDVEAHGAGLRGRKTQGFVSSCACSAHAPVPCSVLDPFGGSGTTAGVAAALGRASVLYELNLSSLALVPERVQTIRDKRSIWDNRLPSLAPRSASPEERKEALRSVYAMLDDLQSWTSEVIGMATRLPTPFRHRLQGPRRAA